MIPVSPRRLDAFCTWCIARGTKAQGSTPRRPNSTRSGAAPLRAGFVAGEGSTLGRRRRRAKGRKSSARENLSFKSGEHARRPRDHDEGRRRTFCGLSRSHVPFLPVARKETPLRTRSREGDCEPRRRGLPRGEAPRDRPGAAARLGDPARGGRGRRGDACVAPLPGRDVRRRFRRARRATGRLEVGANAPRGHHRQGLRRERNLAAP